jgi:ABC-2 type transport system permease protein
MNNIIFSIAKKEFFHIIRDPRSLIILFFMPTFQLIMFGYALKMEIQQINLGIIDYANSSNSRLLIESFKGSDFFRPFFFKQLPSDIEKLFLSREAHAVMVFPPDFDRQLEKDLFVPIQVIIDASDANRAAMVRNYINQVSVSFNERFNKKITIPFDIRGSTLFNPDKKSTYFFVPGLIALLLVMISALLTSITITREKETGTLEQILVSPIQAHEIILGKVIPYIVLAFLIGLSILVIGIFIFKVPFQGSLLLLLVLSILYIITALSLGLMISTIAKTQQVAMMVALIATLLPTFLLSGFIFPIASMPKLLQYITYLVPAKYYLYMARGIILKGSTFLHLLQPAIFLALLSGILLILSIRKFSTTLEN